MVNIPTSLKNLKAKVDDLDVGKLKTVHADLKKLSNVVHNEVVKIKTFGTLKTKASSLEKTILDVTTLIHKNQYSKDKQNLEKKMEILIKKIRDNNGFMIKISFEYKN